MFSLSFFHPLFPFYECYAATFIHYISAKLLFFFHFRTFLQKNSDSLVFLDVRMPLDAVSLISLKDTPLLCLPHYCFQQPTSVSLGHYQAGIWWYKYLVTPESGTTKFIHTSLWNRWHWKRGDCDLGFKIPVIQWNILR